MKHPYFLVVLALIRPSIAQAQDFSGQPDCAISCWEEYAANVGCTYSNLTCRCVPSMRERMSELIVPCLLQDCGVELALEAAEAASLACETGREDDALTSVITETIASTLIIPTSPAAPRTSDVSTAGESSSDLASTTSAPSSTLVSSTSTSASTPTHTPSPSSTSSGLNPAAIGLGVGIGVGGLLIILLALFLFRRHSKRRTSPTPDLSPAPPPSPGKAELPNSYITEKPADDDPPHGRAEAPPHETRHEIPTNEGIQGRHELGTSDPPSWHQRNP